MCVPIIWVSAFGKAVRCLNLKERLQKTRTDNVKQARLICMIASGLLLVGGIALVIWPEMDRTLLRILIGVCFVITGGARIFGYFSNDLYRLAFQFDFAFGVFSLVMCIWALFFGDLLGSNLQILMGIYLLIDGLQKIQTAMDAKHFGMRKWWTLLSAGSVAILVSVPLLFPILPMVSPLRLFGIGMIADAITSGWNTMYLTVRVKRRKGNLPDPEGEGETGEG